MYTYNYSTRTCTCTVRKYFRTSALYVYSCTCTTRHTYNFTEVEIKFRNNLRAAARMRFRPCRRPNGHGRATRGPPTSPQSASIVYFQVKNVRMYGSTKVLSKVLSYLRRYGSTSVHDYCPRVYSSCRSDFTKRLSSRVQYVTYVYTY